MSMEHGENGDARKLGAKPSNGHSPADVGEADRTRPIYPTKPDAKSQGDGARKPSSTVNLTDGDLVAGAGVKLKGEIGSCDTLTVEGEVEAHLKARQIVVANGGAFTGRAEVSEAEISGRFEGTLHTTGKLIVRRTGRVNGQILYGQLEIEPGGELRGRVDVQFGGGGKKNGILGSSEKSWSWMS